MIYLLMVLIAACSSGKWAFGQDMTVTRTAAVAEAMAAKGDTVVMCTENINCKSIDTEEAYLMFKGEELEYGFFVPVEGFMAPKAWKPLKDGFSRVCEDSKVYASGGLLFVVCGSERLGYPYILVFP